MRRRYIVAVSIAATVVSLDLATKRFAALNFVDQPTDVIPGILSFTYTENPGAAFSLFQDGGQLFAIAAILVVGVLLYTVRLERPVLELVAYGLVMGGAVGNLTDRVFRAVGFLDGNVIDWINLWIIPTFNVADASITVAVVLLIIDAWRRR